MAAHTGQSTRSRRFIKFYLGTWGLLAVGALGYLAMLAFPRQADAPSLAAIETARNDVGDSGAGDPGLGDPKPAPQSDSRPLAEAQDSQSEIHKDAARLPDAVGEGEAPEKSVRTRLSALEKRVPPAVGDTPRPSSVPGITIADAPTVTGTADTMAVRTETTGGTPLPGAPATAPGEAAPAVAAPPPFVPIETGSIAPPAATATTPIAPPRILKVAPVTVAPVDVVPETADAAPEARPAESKTADAELKTKLKTKPKAKPKTKPKTETETVETAPATEIRTASLTPETGSVAPKEEIVFGEPVVTRGGHEFAVQLAASPSAKALRRSWGKMAEQHAGALGNLQPRLIPPGPDSGVYRLLAGPVPSKAEAERICEELAVGPNGCFATNYAGAPL